MLPGEEVLEKKKKKLGRPNWSHVKAITADVLRKVIDAENERRDSQVESERNRTKAAIFGCSKLYKLLSGVKGITFEIDYDPSSYKNTDVTITAKADEDGIDDELREDVSLPAAIRKSLVKLDNISTDPSKLKEASQTIAAYVLVELEKTPNADMLDIISKHVSEWVKSQ